MLPPDSNPVLVLNRSWQPVHICGVRRAIGLLFLEHAEIVHTHPCGDIRTHDLASWIETSAEAGAVNGLLHAPRVNLAVPRVIVLSRYDRLPRREVRFSRENVFARDGHVCQYCGTRFEPRQLNLDHVIPREKGGRTTWENVVTSCIPCNSRKANKLPHVAGMSPLRKPAAPRWRPLAGALTRGRLAFPEWAHFVEVPHTRVTVG